MECKHRRSDQGVEIIGAVPTLGGWFLEYKIHLLITKNAIPPDVRVLRSSGMEIFIVPITKEMRSAARRIAVQFNTRKRMRGSRERFKVFDKNPVDLETFGILGELAVSTLFLETYVDRLNPTIDIGWRDEGDLNINGYSIDVKTCSKEKHKYLTIPPDQRPHDFYIGVKLVRGEAWIYGYATREMVERASVRSLGYGPTRVIPLEDLRPVSELVRIIREAGGKKPWR